MIVIEIVTQPEREGHFSIVQVSSTIEWITTHLFIVSCDYKIEKRSLEFDMQF